MWCSRKVHHVPRVSSKRRLLAQGCVIDASAVAMLYLRCLLLIGGCCGILGADVISALFCDHVSCFGCVSTLFQGAFSQVSCLLRHCRTGLQRDCLLNATAREDAVFGFCKYSACLCCVPFGGSSLYCGRSRFKPWLETKLFGLDV